MSKSQHIPKFRAMVAQEYIDGVASFYYFSNTYHIGKTIIQKWVALYREHGIEAFITSPSNKSYSKDFKIFCVESVLSGDGSSVDIASKNNMNPSVLES